MNQPTHILLLEDHGLVRAGFKALLKESLENVIVYEAASYLQAIEILDKIDIEFAFLDYKLGNAQEKSGLDVLHYIRAQELATRAIIVTAGDVYNHGSCDLVMQCIMAGAFGYISKATEGHEVLREAIDCVLQGRVFLPASVLGTSSEAVTLPNVINELAAKGRALDVLYYLCQGDVNKTIAKRMQLVEGTVRDYVSYLLKYFAVKNRTQLLLKVARLQIAIPKPNLKYAELELHEPVD